MTGSIALSGSFWPLRVSRRAPSVAAVGLGVVVSTREAAAAAEVQASSPPSVAAGDPQTINLPLRCAAIHRL